MARIVIAGYMIRHPLAGNLFAYFHYLLGLHRLGHQVVYVEESGWPSACYDPERGAYGDDPRSGLRAVHALLAEYGVNAPVCYVDRDTGRVEGASWAEVKRLLGAADLLLNIGGVCWLPEFRLVRRRAFVDLDPLFTQVGRFGAEALAEHHVHFSYGVNLGRAECTIPTGGLQWRPTVAPVVLDAWKSVPAPDDAPLTTVANWSAYGGVIYDGESYGQKDQEFVRLEDLPRCTTQRLELALAGAGSVATERLQAAGWSVCAAAAVSSNVSTYRAYIAGSRGELSVAKHAYVKTWSGWFSDRSVCYLAAGRPTILQDTGFTDWLPTGRGVLSFSTVDEAADSIARMNADYPAHCRAASDIAERVFSHDVVLPRLVETALGSVA